MFTITHPRVDARRAGISRFLPFSACRPPLSLIFAACDSPLHGGACCCLLCSRPPAARKPERGESRVSDIYRGSISRLRCFGQSTRELLDSRCIVFRV